jgi:hypothetical protein
MSRLFILIFIIYADLNAEPNKAGSGTEPANYNLSPSYMIAPTVYLAFDNTVALEHMTA